MSPSLDSEPKLPPIYKVAYTLDEWDQEVEPHIGKDRRYKPLPVAEKNKGLYNLIVDTETGVVYRFNFRGQNAGAGVFEAPKETWVNCVEHLKHGGQTPDV